jgi:hypothetical protein
LGCPSYYVSSCCVSRLATRPRLAMDEAYRQVGSDVGFPSVADRSTRSPAASVDAGGVREPIGGTMNPIMLPALRTCPCT